MLILIEIIPMINKYMIILVLSPNQDFFLNNALRYYWFRDLIYFS